MKNKKMLKLYFLCFVFIQINAQTTENSTETTTQTITETTTGNYTETTTEIISLLIKNPERPLYLIPGKLSVGSKIEIFGQMLRPYINNFEISLSDSSNRNEHDIIFHMSVRINENVIVRNLLKNRLWGAEESNDGIPFQSGDEFKMVILIKRDTFEVDINDSQFCDFVHRLPLESAKYLHIEGDAKIYSVEIQINHPKQPE
ncbi:galectin-7-like [Contarinia nasturtii]|uniref:galectin-7-like n=1 Tax=Contarinia nasturtii TaxID=265458 RepID=UPI0012D45F64|nr:galectin-7-like [Contarinia nasturtii]